MVRELCKRWGRLVFMSKPYNPRENGKVESKVSLGKLTGKHVYPAPQCPRKKNAVFFAGISPLVGRIRVHLMKRRGAGSLRKYRCPHAKRTVRNDALSELVPQVKNAYRTFITEILKWGGVEEASVTQIWDSLGSTQALENYATHSRTRISPYEVSGLSGLNQKEYRALRGFVALVLYTTAIYLGLWHTWHIQ